MAKVSRVSSVPGSLSRFPLPGSLSRVPVSRLPDSRECQLRYNPCDMKGKTLNIAITGVVCVTAILLSNRLGLLSGQEAKVPGSGFAAVPGQKGGQDVFGPYDPVQNWEKPLAESLPELKGWTFSQA